MTILVFGYSGQVATELRRDPEVTALGRDMADLNDPAACAAAIRAHAPRAVINAAAYTNVDRAEGDEAQAMRINAEAPGAMARACAALDIPLVQISTDYVFSGDGTAPWRPENIPAPRNAYGRSKLAGESALRAAGGCYAILRTSCFRRMGRISSKPCCASPRRVTASRSSPTKSAARPRHALSPRPASP